LFADRADRLLVEIVDLAGQHARDAAREKQRQIGRWIVGLRPGLATGRNQHERRVRVQRAQRLGIAVPRPQRPRPALADDQIGLARRIAPVRIGGRPVGVQLVGRPGAESALLSAAARLEQRVVPMAGAAPRRMYV